MSVEQGFFSTVNTQYYNLGLAEPADVEGLGIQEKDYEVYVG